MNPILPLRLNASHESDQPPPRPRKPVDREARGLNWLFGLTAVALVIVVWLPARELAPLVAPTIMEWQSRIVDSTSSDTPPLPPLPASPFGR